MTVRVEEVGARPAPQSLLVPILACAVAGAIVAGAIASSSELAFFVLMAVIVGSMFAAVAMVRFWPFVLILLAVRPSLDYFQDEGIAVDAGGLAAATLLFGSVLWLFAGWRAGTLRPLSTLSKLLIVMIVVQLASVLVAVDPAGALRASLKSASGLLMFVVLEQLFAQDRRRIQGAVVAILVSLVPSFVVVVMNASAVMDDVGIARHQGTFGHPNALATYCCMTLAVTAALRFTVTGRKRMWLDLATAAQLVLIVLTYARGAWLSAVAVLLIVALRYSKSLLVALIGLILILAMAVPSVSDRLSDLGTERAGGQGDPNSLVWRFRYWNEVLPEGVQNPITGIGLEQTGNVMEVELAPHNTFLQAFVETGIVGFALLIAVIVVVARQLRRRRKRPTTAYGGAIFVAATAASVAYLLQMPTENLLTHATLQWPLWVLLAAAFELTRTPEERAASATAARRWDDGVEPQAPTPARTNELPRLDDELIAGDGGGTVAVLVEPPSAVLGPAPERHRWWRGALPASPAPTADGAEELDEVGGADEGDIDAVEESDRDGGRSLSRLLLSSSGTGIVLFVANFVSGVITARLLDPDGRGEVLAAMTFVVVIGWMLMLSFDTAMTVMHGRKEITLGEATGATLVWVVITSVIGFAIGWVLIPHFFRALEPQAVDVARLALLAQLPTELVFGAGSMFGAAGQYRTLLVTRAAPGFVHAVFVTVLAITGQLTVRTTILSYVASGAVIALLLLPKLFALVRPRLPSLRTMLRGSWFGLRAQPGQISGVINMRLDVWLLPLFVAAADIGYYGVAVNVASAIMLLLGQFAHVLVPVMSNADEQTAAVRARALRLGLSAATLLGAGLFLVGPTLINVVYGQEFDAAGGLMRILVPGIVALVGAQIVISLLNAAGRPGLGSAVLIPSTIITVVGLLVFLPRYGVTAAAAVSTISYGAMFVVAVVALRSAVGVRLADVAAPSLLRDEYAAVRARFRKEETT